MRQQKQNPKEAGGREPWYFSHGPPDLLINNAGIINSNARLWEIAAREFDAVVDTNLKGVANVIRHFVPDMVKRKRGVIVNFSSGWGRATDAEVAPYCATKWAIEGLTQSLAQEMPSGMAAVPLNPGIIDTEMLRSCFGGSAASYPKPDEWAKVAVPFLLKLGASGAYLCTAGKDAIDRLGRAAPAARDAWADRELWAAVL